jgi:hypothetical protein
MTTPAADLDLVNPDLLPPQVRELVRLIGLPQTIALLKARGGRPLAVAVHPEQCVTLRTILSREALAILCEEHGGTTLDLPKADKVHTQLRNHYIHQARATGAKSGRQLAAELGLTWRQIKYISAEARDQDDNQGDLF